MIIHQLDQEKDLLETNESIIDDIANRFPNEDFVFITDTDKRIISAEEADFQAQGEGLSEDERDRLSDEIEEKLESPIDYFVNERGTFTVESLLQQNFIRKDVDKMAEFVVETDGVAHTLASYDGNEKVVKDRKGKERLYMYRAN